MLTIDRADSELDPAAVFAEHDRMMVEAASDALVQVRKRASPDGLIYRVQENALVDAAAAYDPVSNGSDEYAALNADASGEFDPYTMRLLEGLGDALGMTRIELSREWHAADAKLLGRIKDLQATNKNLEGELRTLTASYETGQARIGELERQVASLTAKNNASEVLVKALHRRTTRITELEDQVKALTEAIAGAPTAGDFDSRLAYIEALMSTMFTMPARSQV
jgi:hypothetical protein